MPIVNIHALCVMCELIFGMTDGFIRLPPVAVSGAVAQADPY